MNKNKIVMCAIGGVAVVAALVIGYLTYAAWEECVENQDSLEGQKAYVKRISSGKIAPSQASVDAIEENRKTLAIWFDKAFEVASRGDKAFPTDISVAEFRKQLSDEAADERQKPGGANGKIVAEDFDFGFKDILFDGKIPDKADLPELQRQWDDIKLFVDTLSDSGAVQLTRVTKEAKKPAAASTAAAPNPRNRNQNRQQEEEKPLADMQSYTIEFLARPLALVKTVNEFARTERFVVVDTLSFERATDALGAILSGKDKDEAQASRGRGRNRGRGRGRAQEDEAAKEGEEENRQKGLVVDPVTDTPFTVTMKITTYDFGTKASGAGDAKEGEEEEK